MPSNFHITFVIRSYVRRTYIRMYSYVRTYVPLFVVVRCTSILLRRRTYVLGRRSTYYVVVRSM